MGKPKDLQDEGGGSEAGASDPSRPVETTKTKANQGRKMSEIETNGTSHDNGAQPPKAAGDDTFQNQLRAVTRERSKLTQRVQELEPLEAEIKELRSKLAESNNRYAQDMHLIETHAINSDRARRAIRREYREEIAEIKPEDRPAFSDFVTSLREDNFYGKLFNGGQASISEPQQPAQPQRRMVTNPNAGAEQPKDPARPLDETTYRNIKSRSERLALARKYGLIK